MTEKSDINPETIHVPGLRPRSGWIVKSAVEDAWSGGHWARRERARANADIAAGYSRDAIVRALMGESQ